MHVRLAVLLRLGVVELQGADTGAGHEEEGDILNVLNRLLVRVLQKGRSSSVVGKERHRGRKVLDTYAEDLQDVQVADDCTDVI